MRAVFLHPPKVEDGKAQIETSILPWRSAQDQFYVYCQSHQHVLEETLCPTCESLFTTSQLRATKDCANLFHYICSSFFRPKVTDERFDSVFCTGDIHSSSSCINRFQSRLTPNRNGGRTSDSYFCAHLGRNSLNMHHSKKCFE